MKTTHFFTLAAMMVASTLGASAQVINETRNLEPFSMVSVSNAMDATIKYGDVQSVVVTAHADVIKNVRTEVNGPELVITFDDDKKFHKILKNKKFKMEVVVAVPVLNSVKASGASDVDVDGFGCDCDFFAQASGASDLDISNMRINGMLTLDVSGASDVDIDGTATKVVIVASGASDVSAKHLRSSHAEVKASGASDVSVHASDEILIDSAGASDVDYYGNPKVVDINAAGSSDVNGH